MNSFESDLKRALTSYGFIIGLVANFIILFNTGVSSDLFMVSIPVICTLPYTTAWLSDYQTGFIKYYLNRTSIFAYSWGKILSCGISGGLVVTIPVFIYQVTSGTEDLQYPIIFLIGMLWSTLAATLAAISNSRYIAYGSSFVICYLLVILKQRYFDNLYCLYPFEWISPTHTWILEDSGLILMLAGFIIVICLSYCEVIRGYISHV